MNVTIVGLENDEFQTRTYSTSTAWCICLLSLVLPTCSDATATATASSTANGRQNTSSRRRKRRQQLTSTAKATKLDVVGNSSQTLRDRWVDILSLDHESTSVRLENQKEQRYYFEAEILADKLMGVHDDDGSFNSTNKKRSKNNDSLLSKELSIIWKSIAIGSSTLLIGIPVAALFNTILTSNMMQTILSSIQSSITPYLLPTFSMLATSFQSYRLQTQAILHSLPYILRHLNHIKLHPGPFLYKLLRKCLILEAWRHIWIRIYKLTRYLWKGTLHNAKSAYLRVCPGWIRRGVKSMFQSMVQAHVHGAVGGFVGSALGGITLDSFSWYSNSPSSSSGGDMMSDVVSEGGGGESMESIVTDSAVAINEAVAEAMVDSAVASAVVSVEDAIDAVVESIDESVSSTILDEVVESIVAEEASVVDAIVESVVELSSSAAIGDLVDSLVEDCLSEGGCID